MKCENCGFDNKKTAKFCTKCGAPFNEVETPQSEVTNSNKSKYVIVALVIVIIILVASVGYFAGVMNSDSSQSDDSQSTQSDDDDDSSATTSSSGSSSQSDDSRSWELIGSYSGSGSGSQSVTVPSGDIMVKLSAYPIKNYASNHLYVSNSYGQSGGVDWGSTSAVETRSDSFTCTLSSSDTFTIDFYETVSWKVEFYRYQ